MTALDIQARIGGFEARVIDSQISNQKTTEWIVGKNT
jgi:hypothetical protein